MNTAAPVTEGIDLLIAPTAVHASLGAAFITIAMIARGPLSALLALALGVAGWTLGEYLVHRFVQHGPLAWTRYVDNHGKHHADPWPARYFVYSVGLTVGVLPVVYGECWLVQWDPYRALAMTGGVCFSYLVNEWVHFCAHRPSLVAGRPWLRAMARNHLRHHHADAARHFGFFTTFWDRLLRTHRP